MLALSPRRESSARIRRLGLSLSHGHGPLTRPQWAANKNEHVWARENEAEGERAREWERARECIKKRRNNNKS